MAPRIPPLEEGEMNATQRELVSPYVVDGHADNVFRTVARHPDLMRRWLPLVNHVLFKSTLPLRDREVLILRTARLCRSDYELAQHVRAARRAGLTDAEIAGIIEGRGSNAAEEALLAAAEELHGKSGIGDRTWKRLAERYDATQLMDIVFTVGQYTMVAMALNSFAVELDPELVQFLSAR